jgi:hypothetical protein
MVLFIRKLDSVALGPDSVCLHFYLTLPVALSSLTVTSKACSSSSLLFEFQVSQEVKVLPIPILQAPASLPASPELACKLPCFVSSAFAPR